MMGLPALSFLRLAAHAYVLIWDGVTAKGGRLHASRIPEKSSVHMR